MSKASAVTDEKKRDATGGADESLSFAIAVARIATDNRADDVSVLDLRGLSPITDFFVLGTGSSDRQMHAVLDEVTRFARGVGRKPYNVSDPKSASWILADYVDVVVHLFDAEHRAYYDLDNLWGDAPRVDWKNGTRTG